MFGFSQAASAARDNASRLANALAGSGVPSPIPLPAQLLANALLHTAKNITTPAPPQPRTNALAAALRAYNPTMRDDAATWMLDRIGNGPTAQRFVGGLLGSTGLGHTKAGVVDFIPGLGQAYQAEEGGQQIGAGHPLAGALNVALAAIPVPAAAKGLTAARGLLGASARTAEADAARAVEPIIAYHGSPHTFDAFDASKIGTGEGAQAYGHGLYFAENEGVAKGYRDKLADNRVIPPDVLAQYYTPGRVVKGYGGYDRVLGFRPGSPDNPWGWSVDVVNSDEAGNPLPGARPRNHSTQPDAAKVNAALGSGAVGSMYQVGINAHPDNFLNWDAPISEQPPGVQAVASAHAENVPPTHWGFSNGPGVEYYPKRASDWYSDLAEHLGGQDAASSALSQAGIPGIKYLDQGSRGAGDGTHNYVVFDPKNVDILKRYLMPLGVGGGSMGAAIGAGQPDSQQQPAPPATFGFGPQP